MILKKVLPILSLIFCLFLLESNGWTQKSNFTTAQYQEDFDFFCQLVADNYAYFDKKQTEWEKVKTFYQPKISQITNERDFIALLESALGELYDFHATLGVSTAKSNRLVPTDADIWAEWQNNEAVIIEVRANSMAEKAGLSVGMKISAIDGKPIGEAIKERLGKSLKSIDIDAKNWALLNLLAGRQNSTEIRHIQIKQDNGFKEFSLSTPTNPIHKNLLDVQILNSHFGYIRFHNSLGNMDVIKEFDLALDKLKDSDGLILDLRDTPSGGNTVVARAVISRFISVEGAYQKHVLPNEELDYGIKRSWLELVTPRGPYTYKAPLVLLVDHWTGSMGEGITVAFDGLKRANIVGTKMARLLGAVNTFNLPNTKYPVNLPYERLYHINGTPRENFEPPIMVELNNINVSREDLILKKGLDVLEKQH